MLMHTHRAAEDCPIAYGHMPTEHHAVAQCVVVSNYAVVSNVSTCHQIIFITDDRRIQFLNGTMDGCIFSKNITLSDADCSEWWRG